MSTEMALNHTDRIRRLNECFLSLGTDHDASIQELTRAAGDLMDAAYAFYDRQTHLRPHASAYWQASRDMLPLSPDPLHLDQDRLAGSATLVVRHLQQPTLVELDPRISRLGLQTYAECGASADGRDAGLLCVAWLEDRELSSEDLDVLRMLGRAIARQERLRQRDHELMMLNEIGRVVTSVLPLDKMLTLLRNEVRDVVGAETCSIALIDPPTGELVFSQADDPRAEKVVGRRLQPGQGIAGQVAETGQPVLVPDVRTDPRFFDGVDAATGLLTREIVCAPLIAQGRTIGVIELVNKRQGQFTEDDVRLLESVAAQTASAIENARLHQATQRELAERVKAERALIESKRRLQVFMDATPDLICLKDRESRYLMINQAFADFWDTEGGEIAGKTALDFMPAELAERCHRNDRQVIKEGQTVVAEELCDNRVIEMCRVPVFGDDEEVTGVAVIMRDVTERKELQEQLIRRQKEESILTLAGGIAHDFNNALVGIVGNIDLLRMELPASTEVEKALEAMGRSAQRMVALTDQLLAYAGGVKYESKPLSLNTVLDETLYVMRTRFDPDIAVSCELAHDLWQVEVNPTQIRQVLVNLLTNARESMAVGGGTLSIRTENVHREAWVCRSHRHHQTGEYVHLSLADTGHGIDEQAQKRLFEPFFTTRFIGRGLGLAVVMGIARDHEGCVEIESEPGRGTTVHVYLPRVQNL